MNNKIYISILLWLSFIVLVISYFTQNIEKQNQAIKETQETVLKSHKTMYNNKFNSMEEWINEDGNMLANVIVHDTVQRGEVLLNSMFAEGKIENKRILPFLYKYYYSREEIDNTEKILKELEEYKGNNEIIKQVDFIDRYQTSFYYLYKHYETVGSYSTPFTMMNIVNATDTTIGIGFYNAKGLTSKVGWMTDASKKLMGIKLETYIQEDTITKIYKVIPSKNGKINPFDYEEIE